jgi:hypothetical protein
MTRARDVANVLSAATALATDTETAAAISSHNSATTSVHGITDTSVLATQTYANNAASAVIPSQTSNGGKYLTTNGSTVSWATIVTDPSPTVLMLMGS